MSKFVEFMRVDELDSHPISINAESVIIIEPDFEGTYISIGVPFSSEFIPVTVKVEEDYNTVVSRLNSICGGK